LQTQTLVYVGEYLSIFLLNFTILKQIASILLLGILAFNIFGYRIYFNVAENNSTIKVDEIIQNRTYNEQDLTTYKFSAKQLPYYTNTKQYEVVNGEVEVNGVVMTYVKKRIYKDSIEYVCLPNIQKTEIRNARDEFFKLVNDLNSLSQNKSTKKQTHSTVKPFSFEATTFSEAKLQSQSIVKNKKEYSLYNSMLLPSPYLAYNAPPPNEV
jgi:hypothetical protein